MSALEYNAKFGEKFKYYNELLMYHRLRRPFPGR